MSPTRVGLESERPGRDRLPDTISQLLGRWIDRCDEAIVIGDRAGVVAWTNEAWTRITGRARADTLCKPITDFLIEADVDVDMVDFVQSCFLRGSRCEVELPFTSPDGRELWIHLNVDPVRNPQGEVSDFVASAQDITARKQHEARCGNGSGAQPTSLPCEILDDARQPECLDLSDLIHARLQESRDRAAELTQFDLALAAELPVVVVDPMQMAGVLSTLLCHAQLALEENWGTISVTTGVAHEPSELRSSTYPGRVHSPSLRHFPYVYCEVHDTGKALWANERSRNIDKDPQRFEERLASLSIARSVLQAHGGELLTTSAVGCGTRVLLLLPT